MSAAPTLRGRRGHALGRGAAQLLAAHRQVRDVARGSERGLDLIRGRGGVEPEAEPPLELLRFEGRLGRRDGVHRAQAQGPLQHEQRPPAFQRRLRAQRHLHQAARRRGLELRGRSCGRRREAPRLARPSSRPLFAPGHA